MKGFKELGDVGIYDAEDADGEKREGVVLELELIFDTKANALAGLLDAVKLSMGGQVSVAQLVLEQASGAPAVESKPAPATRAPRAAKAVSAVVEPKAAVPVEKPAEKAIVVETLEGLTAEQLVAELSAKSGFRPIMDYFLDRAQAEGIDLVAAGKVKDSPIKKQLAAHILAQCELAKEVPTLARVIEQGDLSSRIERSLEALLPLRKAV